MSFLDKIIKPAAIIGGSALLGSYLFPETAFAATGGLLGSDPTAAGGSAFIGPLLESGAASTSIWSNPTVLSSSILAGTSLLGGLFGSDSAEEINQQQFAETMAEKQRQFDAQMALEREQLGQALEIAKIQAGAAGAGASASRANAASARDAQLRTAKMNAIMNAAQLKSQAATLPLEAIDNQSKAAQNTGAQSGAFFTNMMAGLQAPALRAA